MRHLFFLIICFVPVACVPKKDTAEVKYLGYELDLSQHQSIGAMIRENDKVDSFGSGFVIGEDKEYFYGMTNAHVWNECPKPLDDSFSGCWIGFPKDSEQSDWVLHKTKVVTESEGSYAVFNEAESSLIPKNFDIAIFKISKKPDPNRSQSELNLKPLKLLVSDYPHKQAYQTHLIGYPGGVRRPGQTDESTTLVRSSGMTWSQGVVQNKTILESEYYKTLQTKLYLPDLLITTSHTRGGNSGSPILFKMGEELLVGGIIYAGPPFVSKYVQVGSYRSAARDASNFFYLGWKMSYIHKKLNKLTFWKHTTLDSKGIPDKVKPIRVIKLTGKQLTVDGEELIQVSAEFSEQPDLDKTFVRGINAKFLDNRSLIEKTLQFTLAISEEFEFNPDVTFEIIGEKDLAGVACYLPKDWKQIAKGQVQQYICGQIFDADQPVVRAFF